MVPGDSGSTETSTRPASELRVSGVAITGAFGYDPVQDRAVPYYFGDSSTSALMPWLELTLSLEADNQLPGPCRITLQTEAVSIERAGWLETGMFFGLDWDWETSGYDDTCPDLDPTIYPSSAIGLAQSWTFGLGLLPITDEVFEDVQASVIEEEGQVEWDTYWVDNVVGGLVSWEALEETWTQGWALGFEVDEEMALVMRTPSTSGPAPPPHDPTMFIPLSREVIESPDGLPAGVYAVSSLVEFPGIKLIP